jgi:hypothetical protein
MCNIHEFTEGVKPAENEWKSSGGVRPIRMLLSPSESPYGLVGGGDEYANFNDNNLNLQSFTLIFGRNRKISSDIERGLKGTRTL